MDQKCCDMVEKNSVIVCPDHAGNNVRYFYGLTRKGLRKLIKNGYANKASGKLRNGWLANNLPKDCWFDGDITTPDKDGFSITVTEVIMPDKDFVALKPSALKMLDKAYDLIQGEGVDGEILHIYILNV